MIEFQQRAEEKPGHIVFFHLAVRTWYCEEAVVPGLVPSMTLKFEEKGIPKGRVRKPAP